MTTSPVMANRVIDGNVASIDASGEAGNRGENGVDGGQMIVHVFTPPNEPTEHSALEGPGGHLLTDTEQRYDSDVDSMVTLPQLHERFRADDPDFPENQAIQYFLTLPFEAPRLDAAGPPVPLRPAHEQVQEHQQQRAEDLRPFQPPTFIVERPAIVDATHQLSEGREPDRHPGQHIQQLPPRSVSVPPAAASRETRSRSPSYDQHPPTREHRASSWHSSQPRIRVSPIHQSSKHSVTLRPTLLALLRRQLLRSLHRSPSLRL